MRTRTQLCFVIGAITLPMFPSTLRANTPDCDSNGIPDNCEIDCASTHVATGNLCSVDFPIPNCGAAGDCDSNGIPDECEPDCDSNGIANACEIESGAADCNLNGVPDSCDFFSQSVLLSADFDFGFPADWSASGLWHTTSACDQGGGCAATGWAYFGVDGTCTFDTGGIEGGVLSAGSREISVTVNSALLTYCSFYDGDRGVAPDGFDSAWVTVNGAIVDDVGPSAPIGVWETRVVDLQAYIGESITIEWNFDSVDAMSNDAVGWQIDQVEVVVDSDCNNNGVLDDCDISGGFSADCNTNGLPDECDLATGADDCNSNGVPDSCESDADCDLNGTPDICEERLVFVDRLATAGVNDGSDWSNAYTDFQSALSDVNSNCLPAEVWVAQGVYRPDGPGGDRDATFSLSSGTSVYAGFVGGETSRDQRDPNPETNACVLSGDLDSNDISAVFTDNSRHVVTFDQVSGGAVLDGFRIQGGVALEASPSNDGAGIKITDSVVSIGNCLIVGHQAIAGAVYCRNSQVDFKDVRFVNNAAAFGGALYMVTGSAGVFDRCRFMGNLAAFDAAVGGGVGGAVFVSSASTPTFQNCLFVGNEARNLGNMFSVEANGAAIYASSTSVTDFLNCTFAGNSADDFGGGLAAFGSADVSIQNTILWNNTDITGSTESSQIHVGGGTVSLDYSCVMGLSGSLGGIGNIAVDPLFTDADGADNTVGTLDDDLLPSPASPCIDAADNTVSFAGVVVIFDVETFPRFADDPVVVDTGNGTAPVIDIGAYERQPDCNNNGVADAADITAGSSNDCTLNGIPDECEPDCNMNAGPDSCDIAAGSSMDCDADGIPDECNIDAGSAAPGGPFFCTTQCANDFNDNGVPDECDISGGTSSDCDGSGIPDENKTDCNVNGTPDVCEDFSPVFESSLALTPVFGGASPVQFTLNDMRPAVSDVTLTFTAFADLASPVETVSVDLNGTSIGDVFGGNANDCPAFADTDAIMLSAVLFNQIVGVGPAIFTLTASPFVDECPQGSSISISVMYLPVGDCNANGVPDDCDISGATSADTDANAVPDECEDCNNNTIPDVIDLSNQTSSDANSNGIPDECEDCNTNGSPDDLDISTGGSFDDNANGIPDECEDCNNNGTLDDTDIVDLTSNDCNSNNLPDECEIDIVTLGGPFFCTANCAIDCNADGTPDECEISLTSGAAGGPFYCTTACDPDCDDNGVPDTCDAAIGADCNSDGIPDSCQPDTDGDGAIDDCESCPLDGTKTEPGICGCGQSDSTDSDADGVIDCLDLCAGTPPLEPVNGDGCPFIGACCFAIGQCSDGLDRLTCEAFTGTYQGDGSMCTTDSDLDGFTNCAEECPQDPNKTAVGECGCGVPDTDSDADAVADCFDLCPSTPIATMVDSNGCPEYGACCLPGGACNAGIFIDEAFCDSLDPPGIYQGNGSTCALNCAAPPPGDYDADADVDLDDYANFEMCLSGPINAANFLPPSALCLQVFDSDTDGDVDVIDYGAFQNNLADF
ncbi:MAG: hypothetical protein GXP29_15840 [Planctomycetes bacterium]|nr:hypothetical protein [Planctomycetota bacterium]